MENSHHRHADDGGAEWRRSSQSREDSVAELTRRSSCEDDVPLNLSLSSVSHRAPHHTDSEHAECDPPSASAVTVDGSRWRRDAEADARHCSGRRGETDNRLRQRQPTLRRPESSPCLRPELRKSSSAGSTKLYL